MLQFKEKMRSMEHPRLDKRRENGKYEYSTGCLQVKQVLAEAYMLERCWCVCDQRGL